jgi:FtsP/CotA-like multicopper oxidase with cupredoxin domain
MRIQSFNRRQVLAAAGAAAAIPFLADAARSMAHNHHLRIAPGAIATGNPIHPVIPDGVLFNNSYPGPTLRLKQGQAETILVQNGLSKDMSVHWHGVRVDNRQDGVGALTQIPIRPNEEFVYTLKAPDAGTYWYHPHFNSFSEVIGGLMGPMVVEENQPYPVDHDLTWLITEFWPRKSDKRLAREQMYNWAEEVESDDVGYFSLVNGKARHHVRVGDGELLRLRVISTGPILESEFRLQGVEAWIIALDGQPLHMPIPLKEMIVLHPGQRMDLLINGSTIQKGARAFINSGWHTEIMFPIDITFEKVRRNASQSSGAFRPAALPANQLSQIDLAHAETLPIVMRTVDPELAARITALGEALGDPFIHPRPHQFWTLNGTIMPEQFQGAICGGGKPLFTLKLGKTYIIDFHNETEEHHPFHLHGHHFKTLDKNEQIGGRDVWRDVINMPTGESRKVAFVADQPGKWMIHCHNAGHQVQGQMAFLEIA